MRIGGGGKGKSEGLVGGEKVCTPVAGCGKVTPRRLADVQSLQAEVLVRKVWSELQECVPQPRQRR